MSNPWVKPDVYLAEMDIYEARRQVLADLLHRRFEDKRAQLARDAQVSPSYLTRLLQPPGEGKAFKRIETDMALKLEQNLGLPQGTLLSPIVDRSGGPDFVLRSGSGQVVVVAEAKATRPVDSPPPRPDPKFTDRRTPPTESEWAILDAIRAFPEEERDRVRAELTEKAGYWERIAKELLKQRTGG